MGWGEAHGLHVVEHAAAKLVTAVDEWEESPTSRHRDHLLEVRDQLRALLDRHAKKAGR